jgi:hypothetical protein
VLRGIFGPKRDEMTEGWRKLRNEELRDLYPSPSILRRVVFEQTKNVPKHGHCRNLEN